MFMAIQNATEATAVLSSFSTAGAVSPALRTVLLAQLCDPTTTEYYAKKSMWIGPLAWELWGSDEAGMIIGNFVLVACTGLAYGLVVLLVKTVSGGRVFERKSPMDCVCAGCIAGYRMLLPGIGLGAFHSVFFAESVWLVGVAALAMVFTILVLLTRAVWRAVPSKLVYLIDPLCRRVGLIGRGEWVGVTPGRNEMIAYRYAPILRQFRPDACWFGSLDLVVIITICALQSVQGQKMTMMQCGHLQVAKGVVMLIMSAAQYYVKPTLVKWDQLLLVIVAVLQAVSMFIMSVGYYASYYEGFLVSAALLLLATVITSLRVAIELYAEVRQMVMRRRNRLDLDSLHVVSCAARGQDGRQATWPDEPDFPHRTACYLNAILQQLCPVPGPRDGCWSSVPSLQRSASADQSGAFMSPLLPSASAGAGLSALIDDEPLGQASTTLNAPPRTQTQQLSSGLDFAVPGGRGRLSRARQADHTPGTHPVPAPSRRRRLSAELSSEELLQPPTVTGRQPRGRRRLSAQVLPSTLDDFEALPAATVQPIAMPARRRLTVPVSPQGSIFDEFADGALLPAGTPTGHSRPATPVRFYNTTDLPGTPVGPCPGTPVAHSRAETPVSFPGTPIAVSRPGTPVSLAPRPGTPVHPPSEGGHPQARPLTV